MKEGKQKCRILKEIRRQIAEANDIELITSECKYRGDCLGTCPKCEAEVHYLEQQLLFRRRMGQVIKIVGVSLGMSAMGATSLNGQQVGEDRLKNDSNMLPQVEVMGNRVVRRCTVVAGGVVIKKVKAVTAKVVRSVDPYLDKEALRVINTMPKWKPGMQRGKPVRVKFTVPVMFRLQ